MRVTSQSFIEKATAQTRSPKVKLSTFNGDILVQEDIDIISVKYNEPHDTFMGSLSSRYIEVEVGQEALTLASIGAEKFKLWVSFVGSPTEMLVGEFKVDFDSSEFDEIKKMYKLVMFDDAFKLDRKLTLMDYKMMTLSELIQNLCSDVEVEVDLLNMNALPFSQLSAKNWNVNEDEMISYRDVINDFSRINLVHPYFDSNNVLRFKNPFETASVAEVSGFDYSTLTIDKVQKPINSVVFEAEEGVEDPVFKRNELSIDEYGITELKIVGSRFMSLLSRGEQQAIVDQWYSIIHTKDPKGFFYHAFESNQVMRPDIEAGDCINIVDTDDVTYQTVVSSVEWTWINGGLKGSIECPTMPETLSDYLLDGPNREFLKMGVEVNRLKKEITIGINEIRSEIQNIELTPGPQGPPGKDGAQGLKGDQGVEGPRGLQGLEGPEGKQGIQGPKGIDGHSQYTHIAYATSKTGANFSHSTFDNAAYIGMYVSNDSESSDNPADYEWTLIKGADGSQGIQGPKGDDGLTPYFHTAWANNSTGTSGFSTTDSVNKLYIGTATTFEPDDPTEPSAYSWTKIKGDKGDKGDTGSQGIQGPKGADGQSQWTYIRYSANSNGSSMTTTPVSTTKYVGIAVTNSATVPAYTGFTWSKYVGDNGEQGPQGIQGPPGANGQPTYTWVKYADTPTSGMNDFPDGKKYIGLAFNKTTQTESTKYGDYQWSLMPQNIEIGGRNLLKNSDFKHPLSEADDWSSLPTINTDGDINYVSETYAWSIRADIKIEPNTNYTFSGKVRGIGSGRARLSIRWMLGDTTIEQPSLYSERTDTWQEVVFGTLKSSPTADTLRIYYLNDILGGVSDFTNLKIEKGNVATDWTPAPEDVQNEITRVETETKASLTLNTEQIELEKSSRETQIGTLQDSVIEQSDRLTMLDNQFQVEVSERVEMGDSIRSDMSAQLELVKDGVTISLSELSDGLDSVSGDVSTINAYFSFKSDGMEIGKNTSPFKVKLSNERLSFTENGREIAYITGQTLYITSATVLASITLGNHIIEKSTITPGRTIIRRF